MIPYQGEEGNWVLEWAKDFLKFQNYILTVVLILDNLNALQP